MEEKILNTIALKQGTIYELQDIQDAIIKNCEKEIRFRVETKHWYGFSEPSILTKKHKLNVSKETMLEILKLAIDKEKERINKLIDMEIENRNNGGKQK